MLVDKLITVYQNIGGGKFWQIMDKIFPANRQKIEKLDMRNKDLVCKGLVNRARLATMHTNLLL